MGDESSQKSQVIIGDFDILIDLAFCLMLLKT